jgi:hypothetical protein
VGAVTAGDVVLVRFPFSDLSQPKLRPAIVLADAGRGDLVLCQVTSRPYGDAAAKRGVPSLLTSQSARPRSQLRLVRAAPQGLRHPRDERVVATRHTLPRPCQL